MAPRYGTAKLKEGEDYEEFVCRLLSPWGITFWANRDPLFQKTCGENCQGCEVKLDNRCLDTGRLSIEIAEKSHASNNSWIPSGICKNDNSWAYIQGNYRAVFVFSKKWLLRYMRELDPPIAESLGTVRKFYIPIPVAEKAAIFVVNGDGKRIDNGMEAGEICLDVGWV